MPNPLYDNKFSEQVDPKKPIYRSMGSSGSSEPKTNYCILLFGKKFKETRETSGWRKHMEREIEVKNADKELAYLNKRLIGHDRCDEQLKDHIKECKGMRVNTVLARDIVLSCSRDWFLSLTDRQIEKWADHQKKWLYQEFGPNALYAVMHRDEVGGPHIHALISFKNWVEDERCYKLQHYKYLDGVDLIRGYQDRYYAHNAKFCELEKLPELTRGIVHSKADHLQMQKFYGILNNPPANLNVDEARTRVALQETKIKSLTKTVQTLEMFNKQYLVEKDQAQTLTKTVLSEKEQLEKEAQYYKLALEMAQQKFMLDDEQMEELKQEVSHEMSKGKSNSMERYV